MFLKRLGSSTLNWNQEWTENGIFKAICSFINNKDICLLESWTSKLDQKDYWLFKKLWSFETSIFTSFSANSFPNHNFLASLTRPRPKLLAFILTSSFLADASAGLMQDENCCVLKRNRHIFLFSFLHSTKKNHLKQKRQKRKAKFTRGRRDEWRRKKKVV